MSDTYNKRAKEARAVIREMSTNGYPTEVICLNICDTFGFSERFVANYMDLMDRTDVAIKRYKEQLSNEKKEEKKDLTEEEDNILNAINIEGKEDEFKLSGAYRGINR